MTLEGIWGPFSKTIARFPVTILMCFLMFGATLGYQIFLSRALRDSDAAPLFLTILCSLLLALWTEDLPLKRGKKLIPVFSILVLFLIPISSAQTYLTELASWAVFFLIIGTKADFSAWAIDLSKALFLSILATFCFTILFFLALAPLFAALSPIDSAFLRPLLENPPILIVWLTAFIFLLFYDAPQPLIPNWTKQIEALLNGYLAPMALTVNVLLLLHYAVVIVKRLPSTSTSLGFIFASLFVSLMIWTLAHAIGNKAKPVTVFFRHFFVPSLSLHGIYMAAALMVIIHQNGLTETTYLQSYMAAFLLLFSFIHSLCPLPPRSFFMGAGVALLCITAGPFNARDFPFEMQKKELLALANRFDTLSEAEKNKALNIFIRLEYAPHAPRAPIPLSNEERQKIRDYGDKKQRHL